MLKYFTYPILKTVDAGSGGYTTTINTPRVDRDKERVLPSGLHNRDEYMDNPLVYWAHEWAENMAAEPIGKTTRLDLTLKAGVRWHPSDRIDAVVQFAPTAKAQNIRALVLGGYVSKSSVGFNPLDSELIEGIPTVTSWDLMEHSTVPLPSNVDASISGAKSAVRWLAEQLPAEVTKDNGDSLTMPLDSVTLVKALGEMQARIRATGSGIEVFETKPRQFKSVSYGDSDTAIRTGLARLQADALLLDSAFKAWMGDEGFDFSTWEVVDETGEPDEPTAKSRRRVARLKSGASR